MHGHDRILQDPRFQRILKQRSRLRWSLTVFLSVAYLLYGLAGIYAADTLGSAFFGTSISWAIAIGYLIVALAIGASLYYVRRIRQLQPPVADAERGDA